MSRRPFCPMLTECFTMYEAEDLLEYLKEINYESDEVIRKLERSIEINCGPLVREKATKKRDSKAELRDKIPKRKLRRKVRKVGKK